MLLNQFFAYAQQNLPPGHASPSNRRETSYLSPASAVAGDQSSLRDHTSPWRSGGIVSGPGLAVRSPVSIVNLLANEEALEPPSRPKTPPHVTENGQNVTGGPSGIANRARSGSQSGLTQRDIRSLTPQNSAGGESGANYRPTTHLAAKERSGQESHLQVAKRRLEREYVRVFMSNLHHIHPMLDPIAFAARCEEVIWSVHTPLEKNKDLRHFFALYNIVVAVGALIADSSISLAFEADINLCMKLPAQGQNSSIPLSSQALSKTYFRKCRALLGDVFEVCSLESAQTLLLMVSHLPPIKNVS